MTATTELSIQDIAQGVRKCVLEQAYEKAYKTYFSPELTSAEPMGVPDREAKGKDAVAKKGMEWHTMMETHGVTVSEPLVTATHFVLKMSFDVTHKPSGQRMMMEELAVYTVEQGIIIREEFFYTPNPAMCS
jgi:hypothetical protein